MLVGIVAAPSVFLLSFGLFTKTATTRSGRLFHSFSDRWREHTLKACRGPLGPKTLGSAKAPHTARGHRGSGLKILNLGLLSHFGDSGLRPRPAFLPLRLLALTDGCTPLLWQKQTSYFKLCLPGCWVFLFFFSSLYVFFLCRAESREAAEEERPWQRRAGREGKAPQMKILNQHASPLQLRPRRGLHLIYSPKPWESGHQKEPNYQVSCTQLPNSVMWPALDPT